MNMIGVIVKLSPVETGVFWPSTQSSNFIKLINNYDLRERCKFILLTVILYPMKVANKLVSDFLETKIKGQVICVLVPW